MMEEQNIGIIKTRIWRTCNLIRGLDITEVQMQQVIIAFTFLRRIDCLISKYAEESSSFYSKNRERLSDERLDKELRRISGGYPFFNYSGYSFTNILLVYSSIEVVLNSYFQGFSKNVQEILDGISYRQNVAILQRKSRFLVELFDSFSQIDLSISSIDNKEFVELVSSLLSEGTIHSYELATPLNLSELICKCLIPENIYNDPEQATTIYDPVCGTGVLLANAGEIAKSSANQQPNVALYGQEIAPYSCAIAKALTLFTGNDDSKIVYGDTLTDDLFPKEHFQYILADMPLGLSWSPIKERIKRESYDVNGRFNIGLPNTGDSQFLFIQHILSKMDPHGSRAAFITSASALWGGGTGSGESRIRRWMFEHDMVEAIIALPGGVLPFTNIPVYLWILNNRKNELRTDRVQLIYGVFKANRGEKTVDVERIINAYRKPSHDKEISKFVMDNDFGFYELKLKETGGATRTVTINLDTDINEYIRKEITPFSKGEISIDYSSVEKGYSVRFEQFFTEKEDEGPSIEELSQKVLTLIEEFRLLESDILISNKQKQGIVKEEPTSYGGAKQARLAYPLNFFAHLFKGQAKQPEGIDLPFITVPYLRDKENQSGIHLLKPTDVKHKVVTDSDVLVITSGANSGEAFCGVSGIASASFTIVRANQDVVMPRYLYYLIKGNEKILRNTAKGASVKSIDLNTLSYMKFAIPSLEEQKQIIEQLDNAVGKIDKITELLGGKDNILTQYRQALIENVIQGLI